MFILEIQPRESLCGKVSMGVGSKGVALFRGSIFGGATKCTLKKAMRFNMEVIFNQMVIEKNCH